MIQLTDPSDPFFYYSLEVSETEFHVLKKEQSLLVDFSTFPANLVDLLDHCLETNNKVISCFQSYTYILY